LGPAFDELPRRQRCGGNRRCWISAINASSTANAAAQGATVKPSPIPWAYSIKADSGSCSGWIELAEPFSHRNHVKRRGIKKDTAAGNRFQYKIARPGTPSAASSDRRCRNHVTVRRTNRIAYATVVGF